MFGFKRSQRVDAGRAPDPAYYHPDTIRLESRSLDKVDIEYPGFGISRINAEPLVGASAFESALYASSHVSTLVGAELAEAIQVIEKKFHGGQYDAQALPLVEAFLSELHTLARIQIDRNEIADQRIADLKAANAAAHDAVCDARKQREVAVERAKRRAADALMADIEKQEAKAERKKKRTEQRKARKAEQKGKREALNASKKERADQKKDEQESRRTRQQALREEQKRKRAEERAQRKQEKADRRQQKLQARQERAELDSEIKRNAAESKRMKTMVKRAKAEADLEVAQAQVEKAQADREELRLALKKARDADSVVEEKEAPSLPSVCAEPVDGEEAEKEA